MVMVKDHISNSDNYEGQFQKAEAHGHGTYRFKKDELLDRYVGMWSNDTWDGYGTLVLKDGSRSDWTLEKRPLGVW